MLSIQESFDNLDKAFKDLKNSILNELHKEFMKWVKPFKDVAKERDMVITYRLHIPEHIKCRCTLEPARVPNVN